MVSFIRIKTFKLSKHSNFPLTSKLNEGGVRDFTSDMGNVTIYIDKGGLGYLITFHEAEFEIIDCLCFNEGRSNKFIM